MEADQKALLVQAAVRARTFACAPYSGFAVGAALLARDGSIATGANVESVSYGLTCCAERIALFKALTEGRRDFLALAIVADAPGGAMPCGACRQLLMEYCPGLIVLVAAVRNPEVIRQVPLTELLPSAFLSVPSQKPREPGGIKDAPRGGDVSTDVQ